jgi:hypothetical protein
MSKLERLIKKHIMLFARQDTQIAPGTHSPTSLSCNCCIEGTDQLSVTKICEAVKQLSNSVGSPGSNQCAKDIKRNNTKPCSTNKFTKGNVIIDKCKLYAGSVVAALPASSTEQQKSEASRKAECDCLNNAIYGSPDINGLGFPGAIMGQQVLDFYRDGCSYTWISTVCGERQKVIDRKGLQHLMC